MKTIKSSTEITSLFENGRRYSTPYVNLLVLRNADQHDLNGRVAFIAGKKLGGAVWRNRAKRRMRSVCRGLGGSFPGWDVAFVARRSIADAPFEDMSKQVLKALKKAKVVD